MHRHSNEATIGSSLRVARFKCLCSRGHLSYAQPAVSGSALTRALLCLGSWNLLGLVGDENVDMVVKLDEVTVTRRF